MTVSTHRQLANNIWDICNLLRGPYKRGDYRKVILPMVILRRFECVLQPTKDAALLEFAKVSDKPDTVKYARLKKVTGQTFYNASPLALSKLDSGHPDQDLSSYINGFSPNVREIFIKFKFSDQIIKLQEKNLVFELCKRFAALDLSPKRIDSMQMGYVFEELIRIGAEQSNDESGDHFTPREVIKLMVHLLLNADSEIAADHKVKLVYDPACGTGGMLSEAQKYMRQLNDTTKVEVFGQDWNDESWATCRADMLIKGQEAENILNEDSIATDCFPDKQFDYMLANPPFGVNWGKSEASVRNEAKKLGMDGRYGAGLPGIGDGGLIFLQHMISKMRDPKEDGSRIAVVFNAAPLFTGDAGSGESDIRKWIVENDWLEAIVAMPDQLFYNTGISTYIWLVTNRKEAKRKGKVQFIDARNYWMKMMPKSLGNKRKQIGDGEEGRPDHIADITQVYEDFKQGDTRTFIIDGKEKQRVVSHILTNKELGYHRVTVERPLRLWFRFDSEAVKRLEEHKAFQALVTSRKKAEAKRKEDEDSGTVRQEELRAFVQHMVSSKKDFVYKNREVFITDLKREAKAIKLDLSAADVKMLVDVFGMKDKQGEPCKRPNGSLEPDSDLRDTEAVPLTEKIEDYFAREVLPHVPDAWIDHDKTKVGYKFPVNRLFYVYEPPRELLHIEKELADMEKGIMDMLLART